MAKENFQNQWNPFEILIWEAARSDNETAVSVRSECRRAGLNLLVDFVLLSGGGKAGVYYLEWPCSYLINAYIITH